ncbi:MAG: hypothetical protein HQK96_11780 [Nitrospirae bacterium]|nr:hypothetical protein [Nitrospirota bacterium]
MSVIAIPKSLREKLGDEATGDLAKVINEADSSSRKDLATKAALESTSPKCSSGCFSSGPASYSLRSPCLRRFLSNPVSSSAIPADWTCLFVFQVARYTYHRPYVFVYATQCPKSIQKMT